jgi:SAM-dependent methyltransferase
MKDPVASSKTQIRVDSQSVADSGETFGDSLERIVPDEMSDDGATGKATLTLHLERYEFAAANTGAGTLLDLACGVGYGSQLLISLRADLSQLTGVDLDNGAIEYAKKRYSDPRITFVNAEAFEYLASCPMFDNIVSLETVEHMPDPNAFLTALMRVLKPGGTFVSSVPTTPSMDGNPHHMSDFTESFFRRLVNRHGLTEFNAFPQRQPFSPRAILPGQERRVQKSRRGLVPKTETNG